DIDGDILAKIAQGYRGITLKVVDEIGPRFKGGIMGDAGLQGNGLVRRLARELAAGAWVPRFPPFRHFRRPVQGTTFVEPCYILVVPLNLEFEITIGIKTMGVDGKPCHL